MGKKTHKTLFLHGALPGELVLTKSQYIASDLSHYLALVLSSAMLQNVLDHIVAILVLNKSKPHRHQLKRDKDSWCL